MKVEGDGQEVADFSGPEKSELKLAGERFRIKTWNCKCPDMVYTTEIPSVNSNRI